MMHALRVLLCVCAMGLTAVLGGPSTTMSPPSGAQCKYNFVVPPPDIVNTCKEFNAQTTATLEKTIELLQQQITSLSQGKAYNFSASINPHFVCDCAANSSFEFAFQDCQDVGVLAGRVSGMYEISPVISTGQLLLVKDVNINDTRAAYMLSNITEPIKVYCDLADDMLSWTVIMKRKKMNVSFDRSWSEYREGFGDLETGGDFWLGLKHMHAITSSQQTKYMLWLVLTDDKDIPHVASIKDFTIGDEASGYMLDYDTSTFSRSFYMTKQRAFVTKDYDPYGDKDMSTPSYAYGQQRWNECPTKGKETKGGGWWFQSAHRSYANVDNSNCGSSNLNAPTPYWSGLKLKAVEMKIRPML